MIWKILTQLANPYLIIALTIILLFFELPWIVVVWLIVAEGVKFSLKYSVKKSRPIKPKIKIRGYGFLSGHALTTVQFYGTLTAVYFSVWYTWLAVIVLGIVVGISRIKLRVHDNRDVITGWLLGIALLALTISTLP
tara:strand:- start:589 stop:999 length:411 start_codon:yes stop_codon:yes gene_type:complete